MHKIGILSDTHGLLRPEVAAVLQGCERILHGGDINQQKILNELEAIAPVYAVRGNNDKEWATGIPKTLAKEIFGLKVFLVHNRKDIPESLPDTDLIIYGHSHRYGEKQMGNIPCLNPGSCGPRRFRQEITMAILWIGERGSFQIEKIVIPGAEKKKRKEEDAVPADLGLMLPAVMKDIEAGKTVGQIARKYRISEDLSEQICRMYLTHPGVDVDGILRRLGV